MYCQHCATDGSQRTPLRMNGAITTFFVIGRVLPLNKEALC